MKRFLLPLLVLPFAVQAQGFPESELYPQEISGSQILDAIESGQWWYSLRLIEDGVVDYLHSEGAKKRFAQFIKNKAVPELQRLFNRTDLSDEQKKEEAKRLVEQSILPFESTPVGELNVSYKQSLDYGFTRVIWDNKTKVELCEKVILWNPVWEEQWKCDDYGNCYWTWDWTWYLMYEKFIGTRQPDYYIYRVVNGQDHLLTVLKGKLTNVVESATISPDLWKSLTSVYQFTQDSQVNLPTRAFFDDFNELKLNTGDRVSYKVISDISPYTGSYCSSTEKYSTTASLDADGDGRADFVPSIEYSKRLPATWLPAVFDVLND